YFFHHAARLGGSGLVDWATRFGFGQTTGIELPGEASGQLPSRQQLREIGQMRILAVWQGEFSATPLQIARLYAAIANCGRLLTPRITHEVDGASALRGMPVEELGSSALAAVQEGLVRVVNDPRGTAFESVRMEMLQIAGKTGTAETGGGRADHAWFAGYA